MALKPKSNLKSGSKKLLPYSNNDIKILHRKVNVFWNQRKKTISLLGGFVVLLYLFSNLFRFASLTQEQYPPEHGYYTNEIPARSALIFPPVDNMHILKELGINGLYNTRADIDGNKAFVYKADDKAFTDEEKKKTSDQVLLVKKSFLDHAKYVYKKETNSPEIVIVTLIDFEASTSDSVISIVQNRVDYAQKHKYGLYIRWIQEFVPMLPRQDLQRDYEYAKPLIMRAAIHAFPRAKYVFFLDHESLIMKLDLSLDEFLLQPEVLETALLRNTPVTVDSNIRTYNHFKVENTKLIIPQSPEGYLDMSAFVVSADLYGKAILEFLMDKLLSNYDWESFSVAVAHFLQWHPHVLGKTALIHQKVIAAPYDPTKSPAVLHKGNDPELDPYHYTARDPIVSLKGCKLKGTCAKDIKAFYEIVNIH